MVLVTADAYCTMIVMFYLQLSTIYLQPVDGQNWGVNHCQSLSIRVNDRLLAKD